MMALCFKMPVQLEDVWTPQTVKKPLLSKLKLYDDPKRDLLHIELARCVLNLIDVGKDLPHEQETGLALTLNINSISTLQFLNRVLTYHI